MKREFTLPLPPSVNALYPGKVRRYKSDAYFNWELLAAEHLRSKHHLPRAEWPQTTHTWRLHIICHMASKARDLDNTLKAGIDLIASYFALDDKYLDEIHITRVRAKPDRQEWEVVLTVDD